MQWENESHGKPFPWLERLLEQKEDRVDGSHHFPKIPKLNQSPARPLPITWAVGEAGHGRDSGETVRSTCWPTKGGTRNDAGGTAARGAPPRRGFITWRLAGRVRIERSSEPIDEGHARDLLVILSDPTAERIMQARLYFGVLTYFSWWSEFAKVKTLFKFSKKTLFNDFLQYPL